MSHELDDELDPELHERLAGLKRELAPSEFLEERTVRALKARGLLQPRRAWWSPGSPLLRIAATFLLFVSGLTVGHWMGGRNAGDLQGTGPRAGQVESASKAPAARIEQAGEAYLQAVMALSEQSSPEARTEGREAALSSLRAAAGELSKLPEEDPALARAVAALNQAVEPGDREASVPRQVFWF
jgi:hypothetical protein